MVGSYELVIEDSAGRAVAVHARTSRVGRPLVGDEVAIEGKVYCVVRVRFEDDPDDRTVRRYQLARVFVRPRAQAGPVKVLRLEKRK